VMWARTSFVDSPDKYALPKDLEEFADRDSHLRFKETMAREKAAGLHQDQWRQNLPIMAETCFTCRIGYRDVVKLAKYFFYLSERHHRSQEFLQARFRGVAEELMGVTIQFVGSRAEADRCISGMGLAKFLHEGVTSKRDLDVAGNFYFMGMEMPFWLRAHFVRHRPLSFVDDLLQKIVNRRDIMNLTIREPIVMEIGASKPFWKTMCSKRSCWLTQSTLSAEEDPWAKIVGSFGGASVEMLPCSDGHCPHGKDAQLRVDGRDPGCPCPRYMKLNEIDSAPFADRLEQALVSRPAFWRDECAAVSLTDRE